jgi:hypothetical protein
VTFPTDQGATQYRLYTGARVPGEKKLIEDWIAKNGTVHDVGSSFEVVEARGDALARVRFAGCAEATWVSSREMNENSAVER